MGLVTLEFGKCWLWDDLVMHLSAHSLTRLMIDFSNVLDGMATEH